MALPSKYGIDKKINSMEGLSAYELEKTENVGTASSGWWNPDHAARMALKGETWINNLNGDGEKFVSSVINGISLANAAGANLKEKDMPNSLMKQIYGVYDKNTDKDLHGHLMANGNSSVADVIEQCGLEREIADALSDYAVGGDYKKSSYFGIQRMIERAEKNLGRVKDYSKANYLDANGKETPVEKIFESNLKNYKGYLKELKEVNPLGNKLDEKTENGGKGSGNFGHAGRPGEVGGSSSDAVSVGATFDKDRDNGGRLKEYQAKLREIQKAIKDDKYREKHFYGLSAERLREYEEDMKKNIKRESTRKDGGGEYAKRKDYKDEQKGVEARDGHNIGTEFADLEAQLSTARTNLKMLQKDSGKAYDDLAGRNRYLTRQSEIARASSQARALAKSKLSTETKKLVKEMEIELRSIMADYTDLGTKKYFDPDLNVER